MDSATGDVSYNVYRNTTDVSSTATEISTAGAVTTTSYTDTTVTAGVTYYYWIVAVNAQGASGYGAGDYGSAIALLAPTGVTASDDTYTDHVEIDWTAATGATGYNVYRSTTNDSSTATVLNSADITATTCNDDTATATTTYYYWVVATDSLGTGPFSASATGVCAGQRPDRPDGQQRHLHQPCRVELDGPDRRGLL